MVQRFWDPVRPAAMAMFATRVGPARFLLASASAASIAAVRASASAAPCSGAWLVRMIEIVYMGYCCFRVQIAHLFAPGLDAMRLMNTPFATPGRQHCKYIDQIFSANAPSRQISGYYGLNSTISRELAPFPEKIRRTTFDIYGIPKQETRDLRQEMPRFHSAWRDCVSCQGA